MTKDNNGDGHTRSFLVFLHSKECLGMSWNLDTELAVDTVSSFLRAAFLSSISLSIGTAFWYLYHFAQRRYMKKLSMLSMAKNQ